MLRAIAHQSVLIRINHLPAHACASGSIEEASEIPLTGSVADSIRIKSSLH
jgi:hypothetical protein